MKKRKKFYPAKGGFLFTALFLLGFLVGMFLPNLAWRLNWKKNTLTSYYLLSFLATESIVGKEYFLTVLSTRGSWFLFCILCGFSIFGLPLAIVWIMGMGITVGAVLTMSILQFGFAGGLLGLGMLLPHYIFYFPASFAQSVLMGRQSGKIWKGPSQSSGSIREAAGLWWPSGLTAALLWSGGILAESFLNPLVIKKILETMKFF
ncbi:MAG: stage II sporulation protein M [Blautia sp.]|nr:stage II sporulation protein M [Blautia sp.]